MYDVLLKSEDIARRTSPRSESIKQRHLFAAFITTPDSDRDGPAAGRTRLEQIGIDIADLRRDFRAFVRPLTDDDQSEWDTILGTEPAPVGAALRLTRHGWTRRRSSVTPPAPAAGPAPSSAFIVGTSGYSPDSCGVGGTRPVPDHLGVEAKAHRLAELIALRETRLPLAIGLFGEWGSGKSHFMNLIDRRLKAVMAEEAKRQKDAPLRRRNGAARSCRSISTLGTTSIQNPWASLVSQIFESLFLHLSPRRDELAEVRKLLEASGATARVAEEVRLAHTATEQAQAEVTTAEKHAQARGDGC